MDVLDMARKGFELLQQGREILADVRGAIADGDTALHADKLDQLQEQLANEEAETREAHDGLNDAIAAARDRL